MNTFCSIISRRKFDNTIIDPNRHLEKGNVRLCTVGLDNWESFNVSEDAVHSYISIRWSAKSYIQDQARLTRPKRWHKPFRLLRVMTHNLHLLLLPLCIVSELIVDVLWLLWNQDRIFRNITWSIWVFDQSFLFRRPLQPRARRICDFRLHSGI